MVLKVSKAVAAQPQFENPDEGDSDDVAVAEASVGAEPAAVVAKPAASGAVAVAGKKYPMQAYDVISLLEDRLPAVDFGEGPRLVASNGQVMDGEKKLLGSSIGMTVISWNKRFVISPGTTGADSKELARYSFDGKRTSKGEDVDTYLTELQASGYPKAACKMYVDLFGLLTSAQQDSKLIGKAVTLSLSPDSVKSLAEFRRNMVLNGLVKGGEPLNIDSGIELIITTEVRSGGGNTWTRLVYQLA